MSFVMSNLGFLIIFTLLISTSSRCALLCVALGADAAEHFAMWSANCCAPMPCLVLVILGKQKKSLLNTYRVALYHSSCT